MYCPRKQNQSNFQKKIIAHDKITSENISTEIFVRFKGIKINIITSNLDHNKPHSKLQIVSLKINGSRKYFQNQQRNYIQNSCRQIYPGSNQRFSNQQSPQILLFQNPNNETNQNQPPNVQYINEQDVTEQISMIRQHPRKNSSQIQLNYALTYQAFRTGCNTLLKYIK